MPATRVIVGVARGFVELGLALGVDGTADITLAMGELELAPFYLYFPFLGAH